MTFLPEVSLGLLVCGEFRQWGGRKLVLKSLVSLPSAAHHHRLSRRLFLWFQRSEVVIGQGYKTEGVF